jgi:predicted RNA-binding protein with PIN domain
MIVIIDGYNLLKLIHGPNVSEMQRSACANLLGRYVKKRQHKVIMVFDAGPCIYPMQEKKHGITVIYSGSFQSADDTIVKFVQDNAQKEILVISADRELLQQVEQLKAHTLEPLVFYAKVREVCTVSDKTEAVQADGSVIKFTIMYDDENYADVDEIMYEAAYMKIPEKDNSDYTSSSIKKNDLSKKEKLRKKAWDKL